jgi:glycosyltransferase involved in cell wall biosynthesis
MNKPEILFVSHSADISGAPISILNLCLKLREYNIYSSFILPDEGKMADILTKNNIDYYIIKKKYKIGINTFFNKMSILQKLNFFIDNIKWMIKFSIFLMENKNFKIVHTNTNHELLSLLVSKIFFRKTIWHIHEPIQNKNLFYLIIKIFSYLPDVIVFVSKSTQKAYIEKKLINPKKSYLIYNGIETKILQQKMKISTPDTLKEKDLIKIGLIANINKMKGQDILVEIINLIMKESTNFKVYLIGRVIDEEFHRQLKELISVKHLENIIFLIGEIENIYEWFSNIDIVLLSSRAESFPISIIEAMYFKKPVIAFEIDGIPEIISNGHNGILISPFDKVEFSKNLINLINDPQTRIRLGENANKTVLDKFTMENVVKEYLVLLDKL